MMIQRSCVSAVVIGIGVWVGSASADGPFPTGACCLLDGGCIVTTSINCFGQGGSFQGSGSSCATAVCSGGCCLPNGTCTDTGSFYCDLSAGLFQGLGNNCDTHAQECVGACCDGGGSCSQTGHAGCPVGEFAGLGSTCGETACVGACCLGDGTCVETGSIGCASESGAFHGEGTTCEAFAGSCVGACCGDDGLCVATTDSTCAGAFFGLGVDCGDVSCMGACCLPDGACQELAPAGCESAGGVFHGEDSECALVVCPFPTGFTYQGRLVNGVAAFEGLADIRFSLWDQASGGVQVGASATVEAVEVSGGLFTAYVDFGVEVFDGKSVFMEIEVAAGGGGDFVTLSPRQVISAVPYALQTRGMYTSENGRVGLGTAEPGARLHVETPSNESHAMTASGSHSAGTWFNLRNLAPGGTDWSMISTAAGSPVGAGKLVMAAAGQFVPTVTVTPVNEVGVNVVAPEATLHVGGSNNFADFRVDSGFTQGTWFNLRNLATGGRKWSLVSTGPNNTEGAGKLLLRDDDAPAVRMLIDTVGNVGIGTLSPQARLDVNGTTRTRVIEIVGGADIAEGYDIAAAGEVAPLAGMVVSIDPGERGKLRVSALAYDRAVAGVISGAGGVNPGMTLTQAGSEADGRHPVASVGRVWCLVDADANGAISAGDLITSSERPGHGMKVTDHARSQGAIIGKAMTSLESGQGLVLVLVALQ